MKGPHKPPSTPTGKPVQPERKSAGERWEPLDREEARSHIGEGLHSGFRKGTDAVGAMDIWRLIDKHEWAWAGALDYLMDGLEQMGMAVCKKVEAPEHEEDSHDG